MNPDNPKDLRLAWIKSDGTPLVHGAAAANATTYYAELQPNGPEPWMWIGLEWDATEATLFTLESAGKSSADLTSYAAAGTGWTSQATALGTITAASAASCGEWQVADVPQGTRWRVKRLVTTGGVATARGKRY